MPPRPGSKWAPWCLPIEKIADRLLPSPPLAAAAESVAEPAGLLPERAGHLGYRAEMELLSRGADCARVNMFKAHPDLEPNEYVVYDLQSRGIAGIQVKAVSSRLRHRGTLLVYRPAFRPSPSTWFVVFVADDSDAPFDELCAVIPSQVVASLLVGSGRYGELLVVRGFGGRLARWRVPLAELGVRLAEVAASPA